MSKYSEQVLAHIKKYGPESAPGEGKDSARAIKRKTQSTISIATQSQQEAIEGPFARLIGHQTGVDGFTLKNILAQSGSAGATAKVLVFEGNDGVTYYVNASASKA